MVSEVWRDWIINIAWVEMYVSGIGHISVSFYRNARKKLLPNSEKVFTDIIPVVIWEYCETC